MAAKNTADLAGQVDEASTIAAHSLNLISLQHSLQTMKMRSLGEGAGETIRIWKMITTATVPLCDSDYLTARYHLGACVPCVATPWIQPSDKWRTLMPGFL
jgi:hypothetical protein